MSTTSIAQPATDEQQVWYFTFGSNQKHPISGEKLGQSYTTIAGTRAEARSKMIAVFGKCSGQHESAEHAGVDRWHLAEIPFDAEPESKIWACPHADCTYHIAYGPVADGEASTDELISEHLEDHTDDAAEALAVADPPELVDEVPAADPKRAAYTQGLRDIANWLDAHPEVELPYLSSSVTGSYENVLQIFLGSWSDDQRGQMATVGRAMGKFEKHAKEDGDRFTIYRRFAGITLAATADRDEVCERVVVSTREVTEEVPDPEALAAVPMVKVTKTVEDIAWRCMPLLAEAPKQQTAAAVLTPDSDELPADVAS